MSRLRRFYTEGNVYFITCVTHERMPILVANSDLIVGPIFEMQKRLVFSVEAWVILPEHFHAIVTPTRSNLSTVVQSLKQSFSMNYRKRCCVTGKVWQLRFWDHVIRNDLDMMRHIDYIHYNPVKHGLVEDASEYPLSSVGSHPASVDRIILSAGIELDPKWEYGE